MVTTSNSSAWTPPRPTPPEARRRLLWEDAVGVHAYTGTARTRIGRDRLGQHGAVGAIGWNRTPRPEQPPPGGSWPPGAGARWADSDLSPAGPVARAAASWLCRPDGDRACAPLSMDAAMLLRWWRRCGVRGPGRGGGDPTKRLGCARRADRTPAAIHVSARWSWSRFPGDLMGRVGWLGSAGQTGTGTGPLRSSPRHSTARVCLPSRHPQERLTGLSLSLALSYSLSLSRG